MLRKLWLLLLVSTRLFAQRDTTIDGVKLHLLMQENSDTVSTVWITDIAGNSGTLYEIYPNGKIKCKGPWNNKVRVGTWDEYYANGQLRSHGLYQKGIKEGIWNFYYESGKKYASGNFSDDQRDGLWRTWYENDTLASRGQYWHDYCTGTWKWYYSDGKLKAWARYLAKSKLAKVKKPLKRDWDGNPTSHYPWWQRQYTFFNVDSLVEYYPDGKLRSRILFDKSGMRSGAAKFWFANGQLNHEETYSGFSPSGCWIYYCEDGSVHARVDYGNGPSCEDSGTITPACDDSVDILPLIQCEWQYYPDRRARF